MFVKATYYHQHRAALRGGGYGGSLSSSVQKKTPREFRDRRGGRLFRVGISSCRTHPARLLYRKRGAGVISRKKPATAVGARAGRVWPERDPAAGL